MISSASASRPTFQVPMCTTRMAMTSSMRSAGEKLEQVLVPCRAMGRVDGKVALITGGAGAKGMGAASARMLVAEGAVDICAEPELSIWDMAATCVIVEEAGGRFTGLDGIPGVRSGNAAASNGLLHGELLQRLG